MKKVLLSGYYGFNNSGDDAILTSIVSDIQELSGEVDIKVLTKDKERTRKQVGLPGVDRFSIREVWHALGETDVFVSGGGSLLQDVTSSRSLWYYLAVMYMAKLRGKKLYVFANGVGPINKSFNRYLTKIILKKADLITLRDQDSAEFVDSLGINNENMLVTADPVMNLKPVNDKRATEILHDEEIDLDKPLVGLSLRSWHNENKLIEAFGDSLLRIARNHPELNFLFIPLHYPQDYLFNLKIKEYMGMPENFYILQKQYSAEEIMGIIGKTDVTLAMRLHALIYSAVMETPTLPIIYDPKIEGLMGELDINYGVDVDDIEPISLGELFDVLWDKKSDEGIRLKKVKGKYQNLAKKNIYLLMDLLGVDTHE